MKILLLDKAVINKSVHFPGEKIILKLICINLCAQVNMDSGQSPGKKNLEDQCQIDLTGGCTGRFVFVNAKYVIFVSCRVHKMATITEEVYNHQEDDTCYEK